MKDFYQSSADAYRFKREQGAEMPVFLAAEQIILQNTSKVAKKEQNAVIRLAASIRKYGILEPLLVKVSPQNDGFPLYELIDGERRFRAAALAGVQKLPCLILSAGDKKCLQMAAISELRREKLHYFALSESFLHLIEKYQMTQEEIADKMGLSQSAVANKLRLLRLTPEERRMIVAGGLTERHARTFLRISDPIQRQEAISITVRERYNVAKTEALVGKYAGEHVAEPDLREPTPFEKNRSKMQEHGDFEGKNEAFSAKAAAFAADSPSSPLASDEPPLTKKPVRTIQGTGVTPKKFALRDLKPLYNSIERTLGIFEKTGVCAEYTREEDENYAHIVIRIPK